MISCPVCNTSNHHLSINCSSCGGYIQGRVDNIDLFSTVWHIIENPRAAFLRISLAKYKNYSTIMAALSGVGFVFMFFWYIKAADHAASMFSLVVGGLAAGPVVGVMITLIMTLLIRLGLGLTRIRVRFRNLYAVLAYASVPVILSVVFLLPVEIFSLGRYFFSLNPPPWTIKPLSYYLFLSLDGLVAAWALGLAIIGVKTVTDSRWGTSALIVAVAALCLFGIAILGEYFLTDTVLRGIPG